MVCGANGTGELYAMSLYAPSLTHSTTTTQRRARQRAEMRREQAFQGLANALCMGLGKDAVVVVGDKNVTGGRWYRRLPHKKLMKVLARTTNVVVVGEYFSSKKCCWCSRLKDGIRGNAWVGEGSRKKVSALMLASLGLPLQLTQPRSTLCGNVPAFSAVLHG